jgi:type IV pilus assembly protein PilC
MSGVNLSNLKLTSKERLSFFTDFSTMLSAGIPILECIDSLQVDSKGNIKKILGVIKSSLYNGQPLSRALAKMPKAFNQIDVNLIRSAEAGGTLEATLHDIVVSTKKEMAFNDQLKATMVYPLFVMAVFLGIVLLMLTFVIPRVAKVFTSLNVNMPWITRVLIKISNFFIANWLIVIAGLIFIILLLFYLVKKYKHFFQRLLFTLPSIRKLGINIDLTRFTRSFGLLMQSGVSITEALSLSEKVVANKDMADVIRKMRRDVEAGYPLAKSLSIKKNLIPPLMVRSIKTAETSGTLNQTMQNLTDYFDDQVNESLKILSSLIEPVLIIIVGIMVGALMIAIIVPIYSMISQINATPK